MKLRLRFATMFVVTLGCVVVMGDTSRAQCLEWDAAPGPAGVNDFVSALQTLDLGAGPALYIGGSFTGLGGVPANRIARLNGTVIESLGMGVTGTIDGGSSITSVSALAVFDDGSGPALFATGNFATAGGVSASGIAKWSGVAWSALGSGLNRSGAELAVFDDGSGPALYVCGSFSIAGGITAWGLAKWNGSSWAASIGSEGSSIYELAAFDDGNGMALYAGGVWQRGGSGIIPGIVRWNGTQAATIWGIPTNGASSSFNDLVVLDDGTGSALYACGSSVSSPSAPPQQVSQFVIRWNGTSWGGIWGTSSASFPYPGGVGAVIAFDDGSGPAIYAVGSFTQTPAGLPVNRIAKRSGTTWSTVGSGLNASGGLLAVFDDGADGAADLYVGGNFTTAGGEAVNKMAVWRGCPPGTAYCFGDGIDPVVTAQCPCGNFGDAGHGCGNSVFASGARLIASGTKSPNTIMFTLSKVPNNTLATGFRNVTNDPAGAVFGDGVRCQTGTLLRFGTHSTGTAGDAPNSWSAGTPAVPAGLTRYYLVQYRNSSGFCPPETFNVSHGYAMTW